MKLIVAGTREFNDYPLLRRKLIHLLQNIDFEDVTILCGLARGADKLGDRFAKEHGIDVEYYPADWDKHGKAAGYIRNAEMRDAASHLVAFWDGTSRGTSNMIDIARKADLKVRVVRY